MFWNNILPPFSGSKSEPSKKPAQLSLLPASAGFLLGLFDPEVVCSSEMLNCLQTTQS
jgi:hypothetical protein